MGLRFITIAVVFFLLGCAQDTAPQQVEKAPAPSKGLVFTASNFQTGLLGSWDFEKKIVNPKLTSVHGDAIVRAFPGKNAFYVVNRRGADNIQIFDREGGKTQAQFSVGRASNPQDIHVVGESAWVSFFEAPSLKRFHLSTGEVEKEVSLVDHADADKMAESTRFFEGVGGEILVVLQRLNSHAFYRPENGAKVVAFDSEKGGPVRGNELFGMNPVTAIKHSFDDSLLLGQTGRLGDVAEGGIERIGPKSLTGRGFLISEKELGGNLTDFEVFNQSVGVAIVEGAKSRLVIFRPQTGTFRGVIVEREAFQLASSAWDKERKLFYVADRTPSNPAILVFSSETLELKHTLSLEMPPYHLEVIP